MEEEKQTQEEQDIPVTEETTVTSGETATEEQAAPAEEKAREPKGKKQDQQPDFDLSALLPESIEEVIQFNIIQMREWAFIFMGLMPHPKTKKVTVDMRQAKMAIDVASANLDIVLPHLNSNLQRDLKIMISDLKMNFISRGNQG